MRVFLYLLFFIMFSTSANAEDIYGVVTKVIDGDTIYLDNVNKIRLKWIDAPESKQLNGHESQQYLQNIVLGKKVKVEYNKKDLYGRFIGIVIYDNVNINEKLVIDGYAWSYKNYSNKRIDLMQNEAMSKKIGIWKDANCEPWLFRKGLCK